MTNIKLKSRKPIIEWVNDIPIECVRLAERRTRDMLSHYGRNIASMRIETLVASCYLQGVEDFSKLKSMKEDPKMDLSKNDYATNVDLMASEIYEIYCREVGGKAFNGDPLPGWEEFGKDPSKAKQANAWRKVAELVLNSFSAASREIILEKNLNDSSDT